ncbi:hypothetical protein EDB87DRAFT_1652061 [Lactarius vividus]|nr:hypothetical protein EDB87DRAFT_1652061 [Lactarius vividus]
MKQCGWCAVMCRALCAIRTPALSALLCRDNHHQIISENTSPHRSCHWQWLDSYLQLLYQLPIMLFAAGSTTSSTTDGVQTAQPTSTSALICMFRKRFPKECRFPHRPRGASASSSSNSARGHLEVRHPINAELFGMGQAKRLYARPISVFLDLHVYGLC